MKFIIFSSKSFPVFHKNSVYCNIRHSQCTFKAVISAPVFDSSLVYCFSICQTT